ncbi:hypothetical protein GA0111570_1149 [Raineyella antarctica]|uniref:Antibiotic biosynthesis monooxygenase n=1 Tax=Raineyella antarctica TaxID=1577474 RepID=A0A1G6I5J3_9ACTN|nr:hypothetical protein [Raineyella antarctica]SDC01026.1 hypothetical protein GA0111570_1149 [Raineyella antarctica]
MYARIVTTAGVYDRDVVVEFLHTGVVPIFEGIPGYRGLTASCDSTGTVWTLASWETLESVLITEELSEHLQEIWLGSTHRQLRSVRTYEMPFEFVADPAPTVGCTLQVLPYDIDDPSMLEIGVGLLMGETLPALANLSGCRAARLLVDRDTRRGKVGTVWDDPAAGRDAFAALADARQRATLRGVTFHEPSDREVIFAHVLSHTG